MKIRSSFVSNSSSSSFCIYGIYTEDCTEEQEELAERKLEVWRPPYGDGYYIGKSLSDIGLDETLRMFQKRVDELLKSCGLPEGDGIHEDSWYDG